MEKHILNITDSPVTIEDYRIRLLEILPSILHNVTCEYRDFSTSQNSSDIKNFSTYHTACRSALTHLQFLIKIADWAQTAISKDICVDEENFLNRLILDAKSGIADHQQQ